MAGPNAVALSRVTAPSPLEYVSYLGCKQRLRDAVNDSIGIEPEPVAQG